MKDQYKETVHDMSISQHLVDKQMVKTTPILIVLTIVCLIVAFMSIRGSSINTSAGNQFNCKTCSEIGSACKKHKDYNEKDELNKMLALYSTNFSRETLVQGWLYTNGKWNEACDFCNEGHGECYNCRMNRVLITEKISSIYDDEVMKSMLCDECFKIGKPSCLECKNKLLERLKGMV